MELFIAWLIGCALVGGLANRLGRDGIGMFFVSLVLSPLLGLLIVLVMGRSAARRAADIEAEERLRAAVRRQIAEEDAARNRPDDPPGG